VAAPPTPLASGLQQPDMSHALYPTTAAPSDAQIATSAPQQPLPTVNSKVSTPAAIAEAPVQIAAAPLSGLQQPDLHQPAFSVAVAQSPVTAPVAAAKPVAPPVVAAVEPAKPPVSAAADLKQPELNANVPGVPPAIVAAAKPIQTAAPEIKNTTPPV